MAQLVRHVLGHRSFYPIFPPPEAHAAEVNLDVTHYPLLKMDGPAPDVLILPSKLKHFSKVRGTDRIGPARPSARTDSTRTHQGAHRLPTLYLSE